MGDQNGSSSTVQATVGERSSPDLLAVTLEARFDHPLTRLTGEHPGTTGTLTWERVDGTFLTRETIVGGPSLREAYVDRHEDGSCRRLVQLRDGPDLAVFLSTPCRCDGADPACRAVADLMRRLDRQAPGAVSIDPVEVEAGRARIPLLTWEGPDGLDPGTALGDGLEVVAVRSLDDPAGDPKLDVDLETARVALNMGYYDRPRGCTMEELGEVLGVTKTTVCYRLNRTEEAAVRRMLADRDTRRPGTGSPTRSRPADRH